MKLVWEETFKIRFHDTDIHSNCRIQELFSFLSETCWEHANQLGLGYDFMQPKGLVWAYARKRLQVNRYPRWGETVTVKTWPRDYNRLYIHREFQIIDQHNQPLVNCSALYFAFDRLNSKAVPTDLLCAHHKNFVLCEKTTEGTLNRIPSYTSNDLTTYPYVVDFSDLDMHRHVNNVKYVDWILKSLPTTFRKKNLLLQLDINYFAEAQSGDGVHIITSEEVRNIVFRHSIIRNIDNKELVRAETHWKSIQDITLN